MFGSVTRKFARSEEGTAGLLFGLAAIPILVLAGGVVDYTYVENERSKLQNALDAGTLAAMQKDELDENEVKSVITSYLRTNFRESDRTEIDFQNLEIEVNDNDDEDGERKIHVTLHARVKTPFMGILGLHEVNIEIESEAKKHIGGLEVVMVLDNTGSMRGHKIRELKRAASQLVDTLAELADKATWLKVGLVPYTSYVNVGKDKWDSWWLDNTNCCQKSLWFPIGHWGGSGGTTWTGVVGVRGDDYDILDEGYDDYPVPAIESKYYYGRRLVSTTPPLPIMPLRDLSDEDNVDDLKDRISEMQAGGWTYIPAGLAWGWRVLSDHEPFDEAADEEDRRIHNIRRIIVLMTDGANTCQRYGTKGYVKCAVRSTRADERMRELCSNIKEDGIGIISVAYDVRRQSIKDLMSECGNLGYFEPDTGELENTFKDIANKIMKLYLSK